MKKETIIKRMENAGLTKKDGSLQVKYCDSTLRTYLGHLANGQRIHPMFWTGTARTKTLVTTKYERMRDILGALRIEYKLGNDAPRGGMTGEYIELTDKGRRVLRESIESLNELLNA